VVKAARRQAVLLNSKNQPQKAQKRGTGYYQQFPVFVPFVANFPVYFEAGLPNLAASIVTFVFTSLIFALYRPSSHEN
jgi:hypothetical protein